VVRYHRLPVSQGVLIVGVEPESPAVRAGLREGDMLVAFKGEPIAGIDQLQRRLVAAEIGVASPLTVVRHTEKLEVFVTPEEWEPSVRRN
jgi:S1-C subfamily serine protease